ncbi:MAG: hypothetical protein EZS28_041155, partial [Streblomastix strix]
EQLKESKLSFLKMKEKKQFEHQQRMLPNYMKPDGGDNVPLSLTQMKSIKAKMIGNYIQHPPGPGFLGEKRMKEMKQQQTNNNNNSLKRRKTGIRQSISNKSPIQTAHYDNPEQSLSPINQQIQQNTLNLSRFIDDTSSLSTIETKRLLSPQADYSPSKNPFANKQDQSQQFGQQDQPSSYLSKLQSQQSFAHQPIQQTDAQHCLVTADEMEIAITTGLIPKHLTHFVIQAKKEVDREKWKYKSCIEFNDYFIRF